MYVSIRLRCPIGLNQCPVSIPHTLEGHVSSYKVISGSVEDKAG